MKKAAHKIMVALTPGVNTPNYQANAPVVIFRAGRLSVLPAKIRPT
jgi:hypothetical protein